MHPTRHVRAAVAGVALSAVVALGMAGAAYAQERPTCEELRYQVAAQKFHDDLKANGVDVSAYDADGDGIACEEADLLPGAPGGFDEDGNPVSPASADRSDRGQDSDGHNTAGNGTRGADDEDDSETSSKTTTTSTVQDRDCADFTSQAEAQAAFDADKSDPERLDADDDEIACEDHFETEDDQVAVKPKGGVATGGDGR